MILRDMRFCLFCATPTVNGEACAANDYGDAKLPVMWEARPEVSELDYNLFWESVHRLAASDDPKLGKMLLAIRPDYHPMRIGDLVPNELNDYLSEVEVGCLAELREELDSTWIKAHRFADDYVMNSNVLISGIEEIDKWLEWFLPTSRGHLAKAVNILVRRFPPGSVGNQGQALGRVMKGVSAVVNRYPYDATKRWQVRDIASNLAMNEHMEPHLDSDFDSDIPQLIKKLTAEFRHKNIPGLLPD